MYEIYKQIQRTNQSLVSCALLAGIAGSMKVGGGYGSGIPWLLFFSTGTCSDQFRTLRFSYITCMKRRKSCRIWESCVSLILDFSHIVASLAASFVYFGVTYDSLSLYKLCLPLAASQPWYAGEGEIRGDEIA